MWLSKRMMQRQEIADTAAIGTVSLGGSNAAVVTDGEKRQARVIAPGGYIWQPRAADGVLVLHANEDYIPGVPVTEQALSPGEVKIYSDGAQIVLKNDGSIQLSGTISLSGAMFINGKEVKTE